MKEYSLTVLLLFAALILKAQSTLLLPDDTPHKRTFETLFCFGAYVEQHLSKQDTTLNGGFARLYRHIFGTNGLSTSDPETFNQLAETLEASMIPVLDFLCSNPDDAYDHEMMVYKIAADKCYCKTMPQEAFPQTIKVYPNPATDLLSLIGLDDRVYTISLTEFLSGSKVYSEEVIGKDSGENYLFDLKPYSPGYYILRIEHEDSILSFVIIKE